MKFLYFISFFMFLNSVVLNAQSITAIKEALLEKETTAEAVLYLENELKKKNISNETKKELYVLKAYIKEQANDFEEAEKSYTNAIEFAQTDEKATLKLSAAYCALSGGNTERAAILINSALLTAQSQEILLKARLYAIWVDLSRSDSEQRFTENMNTLQLLLKNTPSKSSQVPIIFTLWWLTNDKKYAKELQKKFANSPEAMIIEGKTFLLPAPFAYFVPRIASVNASSSF